jgi:hypothetical protein
MHRIDLPEAGRARRFPPQFLPRNVPADWCNAVQEEICHVIESQEIVLNDSHTQLKEALDRIFEFGGTSFVFPLADVVEGEDYRQQIDLPWTPLDPTVIREIRFRATVVKTIAGLTENIYGTSEEHLCFFNPEWINLNYGACSISPEGHLFWRAPRYRPDANRPGRPTAMSLIISHVERILA